MTLSLLNTSWWIPLYGLLGAVLTLPWSLGLNRQTGPRPAAYLNLLMTVVALIHGVMLFGEILNVPKQTLTFSWLQFAELNLTLTLGIDPVNLGGVLVVTVLSLCAQIFALGYMEKDWGIGRFFALMGFFEGAMAGLALSESLLLSYCLLELLTLSTYLLVGFWYAQPLVVTAARDAFWTKRAGDLLLLMGVVALSTFAPSLDYRYLADWAATDGLLLSPTVATLLGLALIAGPVGKCAQFPLNFWLDEAMEGPSPASILRNSVVVACGAYVLIKLQPVLTLSPVVETTLVVIGAVTAVGASLVALAQIDIKRAFCHSTSAYLGLVFIAVGLQQPDIALLLLFAHAFAKALLFMSVGSVIFTTSTQDINELGGLWSRMPATTTAYLVASVGLVAMAPLGSFWAMGALAQALASEPLLIAVLLLVNGLTAFNLARVYGRVFTGSTQPKTRRAPEVPWSLAVPLVSVTVMTLVVPMMIQRWTDLTLTPISWALAIVGLAGFILGYASSRSLGNFPMLTGKPWSTLQDFLVHDLYVERLYRSTIVVWINFGATFTRWLDRYVFDAAVNLVGLGSMAGGQLLRYTNTGQSQSYMLTILGGVLLFMLFELLR